MTEILLTSLPPSFEWLDMLRGAPIVAVALGPLGFVLLWLGILRTSVWFIMAILLAGAMQFLGLITWTVLAFSIASNVAFFCLARVWFFYTPVPDEEDSPNGQ